MRSMTQIAAALFAVMCIGPGRCSSLRRLIPIDAAETLAPRTIGLMNRDRDITIPV